MITNNLILIFIFLITSVVKQAKSYDLIEGSYLVFSSILNESLNSITVQDECRSSIEKMINPLNRVYLRKFLGDSAKNKNDMGSFQDCKSIVSDDTKKQLNITEKEFLDNFTYVIISFKNKHNDNNHTEYINITDINYENDNYIVGLCIIKGCNSSEYKDIFSNIKFNFLGFNNPNVAIEAYDFAPYSKKKYSNIFLCLIPVYIMLIFFIFTIFPKIPVFLFRCLPFFRKKPRSSSINDNSCDEIDFKELIKDEIDNTKLLNLEQLLNNNKTNITKHKKKCNKYNEENINKLIGCFDILGNYEHKNEFKNDIGISYLKGVQSIAIISTTFCMSFIILYSSPVKIYCNDIFKDLILSNSFAWIIFCVRHSFKIVYSTTGFSFIYKFLNYLDKETEKTNDENAIYNNDNYVENLDKFIPEPELEPKRKSVHSQHTQQSRKSINISFIEANTNNLSIKSLFKFWAFQLHKYIIFVFFMLLYKLSLFSFQMLVYTPTPTWIYLNNVVYESFQWENFVKSMFLVDSLIYSGPNHYSHFWFIENEILFFIVTSIIVFYCYKHKWRLDIFLLVGVGVCMLIKFVTYIFIMIYNVDFYTTILGAGQFNLYFLVHPFYNYSFFLIGCFFGTVNYSIQKGLNESFFKEHQTNFLKISIKFMNFLKKRSFAFILIMCIFGLAYILLSCFSFKIVYLTMYEYENDDSMDSFFKSRALNIAYLLDSELVVATLHLMLIGLFINGNNITLLFLNHKSWYSLSKTLFFLMLILNTVIYFCLYQSASRIKFNYFNVTFVTLYVLIYLFFIASICYIVFELPLKKLVRLFIDPNNEKVNPQDKNELLIFNAEED